MLFDVSKLTGAERYRLLTATVTPRPIAWVTTLSKAGVLNAAPFSAFNMVGHTPPMLVLGIQPRDSGQYKDTCANVIETGELVINLVTASDAETMNETSADSDPDFDEIAALQIPTLPSTYVAPRGSRLRRSASNASGTRSFNLAPTRQFSWRWCLRFT